MSRGIPALGSWIGTDGVRGMGMGVTDLCLPRATSVLVAGGEVNGSVLTRVTASDDWERSTRVKRDGLSSA